MAEENSQNYPSIPSNYISIAQLQEKWLKEKEKKQQEKEKLEKEKQENQEKEHLKRPFHQNHQRHQNHSTKGWREVGLISNEPKLKKVEITGLVVEEGEKNKKKGYFGKRKVRVERDMTKVATFDVGKEEIPGVLSVENGRIESSKGKYQWNGKKKEVKKVATVNKEVIEEVATVCMGDVVGEKKVDREMEGQKCKVGFKGKRNNWRKMGDRVGEVSEKADSVGQSGHEPNEEKEGFLVDVKERTNEKVRMRGAFDDKGVEEVDSICTVEVVREKKVDREIMGQKSRGEFRRKTCDRVGEARDKADSVEQSGKGSSKGKYKWNGENKEVEEVANVCMVEVVDENTVGREITGLKCGVGFRGKKNRGRRTGHRVGEVSDKIDSVDQSGKERNTGKEDVSLDVKERTNEKVRTRGAFRAFSDKEVEEVATVCAVEVVEENKVNREIGGQKCRVGFKGKKDSWRKMGDKVGEVSDKIDSVEQSGKQHNAEKDVALIDSEAGLKMRIEKDLGDLSLSDKSYGQWMSNVGAYGVKWRYGSSKSYEQRRMLKQRDSSFVWVKRGESSNG